MPRLPRPGPSLDAAAVRLQGRDGGCAAAQQRNGRHTLQAPALHCVALACTASGSAQQRSEAHTAGLHGSGAPNARSMPAPVHSGSTSSDTQLPHGTRGGLRLSLWCTVSGGLEELAMEEVSNVFASQLAAEPTWRVQGNSGSQLAWLVDCSVDAGLEELGRRIMRLRAVEYVSIEISSASVPVEPGGCGSDLLATLERRVADTTDHARFKAALQLWARCTEGLQRGSRLQLGTEGLPGVLLPTPELPPVSGQCQNGTELPYETDQWPRGVLAGGGGLAAEARVPGIGFNVNTIFTADAVAKVVVDNFVALVAQDRECSDEAAMAGRYLWLDAGAGGGALLRHLPAGRRLGLDTAPAAEGIVQADFLSPECSLDWVQGQHQRLEEARTGDDPVSICVISNPPFSEGSRGNFSAITKFINKAVVDLGAGA